MSKTAIVQPVCVGCGQPAASTSRGVDPVCPKCSGAERQRAKAERRAARQAPAAGAVIPRGIVAPQRRFTRHQVADDLPVICYECHMAVRVGADYFREDATGQIVCEGCRERMPNTFSRPAAAAPAPPAAAAYADEIPLVVAVATTSMRPSPRNPRAFADDAEDLAELAASIRQHGVLEPIVVRPVSEDEPCQEEYEIVRGERRWRASVLAGRQTILARIIEDLDDAAALTLTLEGQQPDGQPVTRSDGDPDLQTVSRVHRDLESADASDHHRDHDGPPRTRDYGSRLAGSEGQEAATVSDTTALTVPAPDASHLLAGLEQARALLASARSVDDVKQLRDQAEAMRVYARQAQLGLESQNYAAEIKLRAERRAGEMLAERERNPGGRPAETCSGLLHVSTPPTLPELGISRSQSSRWQAVARVPEEVFDQHVTETKAKGRELTTVEVVKMARVYQHARPSPPPETTTASAVRSEPETEPPLPYTCEGCGKAVLLQVLHVGQKHLLRWTPAEKDGQDWYPDGEG